MTLSSNKSYFFLFHDLNSLDAHMDDLHATLDLLGYNLQSQPSRSAAGGVALYTSKSLNAVKRTDLSVTDEEFETVWVEIKNIKSKSILGCCAYRHPSSSPERFIEHIDTILHNLARENKNILILVQISQRLLKLTDVLESQILSFVSVVTQTFTPLFQ